MSNTNDRPEDAPAQDPPGVAPVAPGPMPGPEVHATAPEGTRPSPGRLEAAAIGAGFPGIGTVFVDVTETVRVREALHRANDLSRLAVAVHDAHDAVTVQDLDGRTLAVNPGAVRMYGWTEAEALLLNVRERVPADQRDAALARLDRLSRAEILERSALTASPDKVHWWKFQ